MQKGVVAMPLPRSWLDDAFRFTHVGEHRVWVSTAVTMLWAGTWLPGLIRFETASRSSDWRPADYIALLGVVLSFVGLLVAPFINVYINRRWGEHRSRPRRRRRDGG